MKKILLGLLLVAGLAMTQKADAQARFSVHLNFGTPGYYAPAYGYNTYEYAPVYRVERVHYYHPYYTYRTYRTYPRYHRVVYTYGRHRAYRRVCR